MSFLRELSARRSALAAPVILTAIALTILLAGCPEETPPPPTPRAYTCDFGTPVDGTTTAADATGCQACDSTHELSEATGGPGVSCVAITPYVCTNGTAIGDAAPSPGLTGCQSCTGDFALDAAEGGAGVSCVTPYVCTNGERIFDAAPMANEQGCRTCDGGFALSDSTPAPGVTCISTSYTCENGDPIPGDAATPGDTGCQSCNRNFVLSAAMGGIGVSCVSDADNDNIADGADNCPNVANTDQAITMGDTAGHACNADIDDDDDGLIEIWTLEQLHNMRYNLAGTSYDDEEADTGTDADTGVTTGAGATEHANCDDGNTATTVVLCGYELMQDLDFDLDGDGSTLNPDGTLDTDDDASPHFVVADGGWEPIGTETTNNRFGAIFEGNGFTISNLAIRRNLNDIGLFGVASGAHIRNVGLVGGLVAYTGSASTINRAGALAGSISISTQSTIVSASYATVNIDVGGGAQGQAGGLIGRFASLTGFIIASYATGNVDGGSGRNSIGGLVGQYDDGSIIASYATGTVTGGAATDNVGGLVGRNSRGRTTTSYATGNVSGGSGNDTVGGLIGIAIDSVTASYATGNVDGGADSDRAGALVGLNSVTSTASYGFGEVTNEETAGVSTMPAGITSATALTAANTAVCSNRTYTTETACTSTSLAITAGTWDSTDMECSAPDSGATAGVDYTTYTTMATCTAPGTKTTAHTWTTWSNAANNTLNAWVFGTGVTPKLRYADYDGAGTTYACSLFPSSVTCGASGDQLPGQ